MARIRIVVRRDPAVRRQRRFVLGSLVAHVALGSVVVWLPSVRGGPPIPPDSIVVELVGGLPGPPQPAGGAAPPPPAVAPEPEPEPEGVKLETQAPKIVPPEKKKKQPPERPKPDKPKPAPPAPDTASETPSPSGATAVATTGGETTAGAGASVSAALGGGVGDAAFGWYRTSVTQALYSNWRRPMLSGLREPIDVRVDFEILRDGTVQNVAVAQSSGVSSLDRSALRAVIDASPLPPLPPTWRDASLPASFVFRLYPEGFQP